MNKVAVFGGSGFLGSYLVSELVSRGYEVVIFDIEKNEYLGSTPFLKCDILDETQVANALQSADFDVVYNLAGFANLDKAIEAPVSTFKLNVIGNLNILEAVRNNNVKRYIYASSAYAMSDKGSFYGISKLSSEKIIEEYQKKYNVDFTILRYGSVYSERAFENNYIYNLIETAIQTGEINHQGDGEEIREYIHAVDAAKLSVDILESNEYINQHLILTGLERIKRVELFNMINEILGNTISVNLNNSGYKNHYKFTPYSFSPMVSKKLVANPYIDMGQGILECVRQVNKS